MELLSDECDYDIEDENGGEGEYVFLFKAFACVLQLISMDCFIDALYALALLNTLHYSRANGLEGLKPVPAHLKIDGAIGS